jgi:SAM-dependent methyltransferase
MTSKNIELSRTYRSKVVDKQPELSYDHYDQNAKKRPSWVKIDLDKKIIFIKILFKGEAFWYRRHFKDYFFIFDANSEDYRNYYNEIAEVYESYIPQNKLMRKIVLDFFKELKVKKDAKILDLGAGTGLVTEGISEEGYHDLTLLDISDKELEIAKRKDSLKEAKYQVVDLTKEEIEGKYDVIFETMSLDYFKGEKMNVVLEKIKNALVDGGKFIVIDRHIYPEFNNYFKEIKKGKTELETPEGVFDYYYFVGEK